MTDRASTFVPESASPEPVGRVVWVSALAADTMFLGALTFIAVAQRPITSPRVFAPLAAMTVASALVARNRSIPTTFSAFFATVVLCAVLPSPRTLAGLLALAHAAHTLLALALLLRARRPTASPFARWSSGLAWHHATALGWVIHGGLRALS